MSTALAPARSLNQRMEALQHANWIRSRRADAKKELRGMPPMDAAVAAADYITAPPDWALTWRVLDVLMTLPKWGTVKAHRTLRTAGVSTSKTLGGMTDRQRRELAEAIEGRACLR